MHTRRTVQEISTSSFRKVITESTSTCRVFGCSQIHSSIKPTKHHQSSQPSILNSSASGKANALVTEIPHSKPMLQEAGPNNERPVIVGVDQSLAGVRVALDGTDVQLRAGDADVEGLSGLVLEGDVDGGSDGLEGRAPRTKEAEVDTLDLRRDQGVDVLSEGQRGKDVRHAAVQGDDVLRAQLVGGLTIHVDRLCFQLPVVGRGDEGRV
jgi:hypothetical protein